MAIGYREKCIMGTVPRRIIIRVSGLHKECVERSIDNAVLIAFLADKPAEICGQAKKIAWCFSSSIFLPFFISL